MAALLVGAPEQEHDAGRPLRLSRGGDDCQDCGHQPACQGGAERKPARRVSGRGHRAARAARRQSVADDAHAGVAPAQGGGRAGRRGRDVWRAVRGAGGAVRRGATGTVGEAPPPAAGATTTTITLVPPSTAVSCYAYTDVPVLKTCTVKKRTRSLAVTGATLPRMPQLSPRFASLSMFMFIAYLPATDRAVGLRRLAQAALQLDDGTTLAVKCVAAGGACRDVAVGVVAPTPGIAGGFTVSDLAPTTLYTCYAIATGPDGTALCSPPELAFTGIPPTAPRDLTVGAVNATAVTLAWLPPLVDGVPGSSIGALCAALGATCSSAQAGDALGVVPILRPGATTATITGLPPYTPLTCWAVASNAATLDYASCSQPVDVTTDPVPPSPPFGVTAAPLQGAPGLRGPL